MALVLVEVPDGDIGVKLRFTELFAKQGGAWKRAWWQATRVP